MLTGSICCTRGCSLHLQLYIYQQNCVKLLIGFSNLAHTEQKLTEWSLKVYMLLLLRLFLKI